LSDFCAICSAQRNKLRANRGKWAHDDDRGGAAAAHRHAGALARRRRGAQDRVHRHGLVRRQTPGAIVDAAATFTDDPSGTPTWIQMHVNGHLDWPAGVGYRVVALTPPDAVR
jgi:hypothetical protein